MREGTLVQAQAHGHFLRRDYSLRLAMASIILLLLTAAFPSSSAAVSFKENHVQHVYDIAPEIKVRGSGFETLIGSELEISLPRMPRYYPHFESMYYPALEEGALYEWDISSDTVITLKLTGQQRRWIGGPRTGSGQFTPLSIASVKAGGNELLDKPLTIATLMPSPRVILSDNVIHAKSTPGFEIKGRFFNETSEMNTLFFDPPLQGGSKVITKVHSSIHCSIIITKGVGKWAAEPGPLTLVGIDTGHGHLHVDSLGNTHVSIPEDVGLVVADIQAELDKEGITVDSQGTLSIYQSTKRIQVSGTGFKPSMKLRFRGQRCGGGANYNITDLQPDMFTLELMEGSKWCKAVQTMRRSARLVLLAVDAGQGWVPLGPTADKKYGQTIANVLEDPSIQPSFTWEVSSRMYHTQVNQLLIQGTGFRSPFRRADIVLEFEPPLAKKPTIVGIGRNYVSIRSNSLHWTTEGYVGPLSVKGMDVGAGMVVFEPPVQVATIVERIVKDFAVDGHLTHKVVDETCSTLCLDLSWDAIVDGNNGTCVCDNERNRIPSTSSFFTEEAELEWPGEISYMYGYESGIVYDSCDTFCHQQGEWDGYNYKGKWVCLCGSGNELSTVGGDWFNEDDWNWVSNNRGLPGGLKSENIIDEDAPKKRIWRKVNKRHKPHKVFDDMAFARREKMVWDLTLFLGGSASCGVGVLLYAFLSRRIRSRRRA